MMYFVQIEGLGADLDFLWEGDLTRSVCSISQSA